ncbi:bifunctional diguanylate cyclase/phosphodiesterase [Vibrio tubiashii]|uniref:Diguanylate cyclase n=2 Tax=Vibrio tubiashii ATCC 19109 TaxID=1051646 RepID=A0A0A0SNE1_9VIBR|nr:EAL domain-containing protein [Vibrio tubiashii]AIW16462.1 diguanylate cyclase [Vibrio tubiashii ATCC 19109]EIF04889.1 hypothetical protein VT1337_06391 [Vibrio tubiashii NCIMB 1337 = ATCC 19106]
MFTLAISMVLIGLCLLLAGLKTATQICKQTKHSGWRWLYFLIVSFVVGYSFVLMSLLAEQTISPILLGLSAILFCGSIFVYTVVSYSFTTIVQLKTLVRQEKYNALHDSLTNLPNRKHCIETIELLIEHDKPFDLMLLDVVNFKQVNDGMGHFCGDQLLVQIGQRISSLLEKGDFIARIGGDEFIVITPLRPELDIKHAAKRINQELHLPFSVDGFELTTSASIGISQFPLHGTDAEQMINASDIAMYWAKKAGRPFAIYDDSMSQGARRKLEISRNIDKALEENEFQIYYQPILCSVHGIVSGYEALIRWITKDGTTISPIDFIPIAEHSNKITSITAWVLDQVTQDIKTFETQGIRYPIHVNLSAKDLMGSKLETKLLELIEKNNKITDCIVLEITESTAINRLRSPEKLLENIRKLGFKISLDDFGTGYSSLSLLRDLPVDQIKIDRSFLYKLEKNERNGSIVANAISLAHGLGYTVVAEGVEDEAVLDILKSQGCDYIQGFYYSPPLEIHSAINWTLLHNPPIISELAKVN